MVSPEQSNASGPAAPNRYGLPSCCRAYRAAPTPFAVPVTISPAGMVVVPATRLPCPPVSGTAPSPPAQTATGCPALPAIGIDRAGDRGDGRGAAAVGHSWATMAVATGWCAV